MNQKEKTNFKLIKERQKVYNFLSFMGRSNPSLEIVELIENLFNRNVSNKFLAKKAIKELFILREIEYFTNKAIKYLDEHRE